MLTYHALLEARPLTLSAELGNIDTIGTLIPYINAPCSARNKLGKEYEVNAVSCASYHIKIVEMLIKAGCPFTGLMVGMGTSGDMLSNMTSLIEKICELLKEQSFYTKAAEAFDKNDADEFKEACRVISAERQEFLSRSEPTPQEDIGEGVVEPRGEIKDDIDVLLLRYFTTEDDAQRSQIEAKITELCEASSETSLKIISTLNSRYLDHPNVIEYVHVLLQDKRSLHEYFQARKDIVYKQIQGCSTETKAPCKGWDIGEREIVTPSDKGVIKVASSMAHSLFIKIAEGLHELVTTGLEHLKVLPQSSTGLNGIKFLKHGIAELKTKALGDIRLIAEGVHVNEDGEMLLYFTESMSHEEVARYRYSALGDCSDDA
ncbi:MAG: hypothetical protein V4485_00250 [Pseudomonadota bacterium]